MQELEPELSAVGAGLHEFMYAVQLFHSRCFYMSDVHITGELRLDIGKVQV